LDEFDMAWKSYLKPENSIVAGVAVMAAVYGVYQLNVGTTAQASATDANHPVLESSRKKAGYQAGILVAGIGLISHDANIIILGAATIIAMELSYRHSIMAHPGTGLMQAPMNDVYQPAENVVPMYDQAESY
jgi:hypothetical protein